MTEYNWIQIWDFFIFIFDISVLSEIYNFIKDWEGKVSTKFTEPMFKKA